MKNSDNDKQLAEELLRLFELALVCGQKLNPYTTSRDFLKVLVSRYNLTSASIWWQFDHSDIKHLATYPLSDFNEEQSTNSTKLHPFINLKSPITFHPESTKFDKKYEILKAFLGVEHDQFAVYPFGGKGVLVMRTPLPGILTTRTLNSLIPVMRTLGTSLQGGIAHEELARSKQSLSHQRSFLKTLVNTLPDLVWLKNPEGAYLACNSRFEKLYGAPEPYILGKTDYDFVSKELADFFRKHDQRAIKNGIPTVNEERVTFASDGHEELLETIKTPMLNEDGEMVGVLGIGRDITKRRQTEEQLQFSENSYRSLFDNLVEGVCIQDQKARFINVNNGVARMFGYPSNWFADKATDDLLAPELNDSNHLQYSYELAASGMPCTVEIWGKRANGSVFPLEIRLTPGQWFGKAVVFGMMMDITERKEAEKTIEYQATIDELTDLPNRRQLLHCISNGISNHLRHNHVGAILFIDLDNFKHINDFLGHPIGDQLLQQVAIRLQSVLREEDTCARLGGDEFVILLPELSNDSVEAAEHAQSTAEKILRVLNIPFDIDSHRLHTSTSIGITLFPKQDTSATDLLKCADTAMYRAKEKGKNTFSFYLESMQLQAQRRMEIQNALRYALAQDELNVHFQPQMDQTGELIGAEALLRWYRPGKEQIKPEEFIRIAEESGQILDIGRWVLVRSLTALKTWLDTYNLPEAFRLSVNLSPQQFRQANFTNQLLKILNETEVNPDRLVLELTEGVLIENHSDAVRKMKELKQLGIRFSIDDFGTGYSSLSYLKKLPVDEIKIDRSFVMDITQDPDDAMLVETIINMARNLKLDVVAEGVETISQLNFLVQKQCELFQGYHFSKPLPKNRFEALLHNSAKQINNKAISKKHIHIDYPQCHRGLLKSYK